MAANDKFKRLVGLLHQKTKAGVLEWTLSDIENTVRITIADRQILLAKRGSDFQEKLMVLYVYDANSNLVDKFSDEDLVDLLPFSNENPYAAMEEIYQLALNKAKGIDENIDAILDELDDEVPF